MQKSALEVEAIVDQHTNALRNLRDDAVSFKPSPTKWSKKEILGHLVDSAQNNIRRFIIAQYDQTPFIVYNQDQWVALSHYQEYDMNTLIDLWRLLNKHMAIIIKNMPAEMATRKCKTGDEHTLEWLALDYIKHLKHHLHQVLDLEPVAYP